MRGLELGLGAQDVGHHGGYVLHGLHWGTMICKSQTKLLDAHSCRDRPRLRDDFCASVSHKMEGRVYKWGNWTHIMLNFS